MHIALLPTSIQADQLANSMIVFRIPVVIPTQWKWVALFFVIGFFGYGAQVRQGYFLPSDINVLIVSYLFFVAFHYDAGSTYSLLSFGDCSAKLPQGEC